MALLQGDTISTTASARKNTPAHIYDFQKTLHRGAGSQSGRQKTPEISTSYNQSLHYKPKFNTPESCSVICTASASRNDKILSTNILFSRGFKTQTPHTPRSDLSIKRYKLLHSVLGATVTRGIRSLLRGIISRKIFEYNLDESSLNTPFDLYGFTSK
ncbi:hypothetical protein FF38_06576 [Lucilia cuprina]|uniref:Uncharacterized protein n=1 Tax=Lucilia cuprina TaxID=7375 RepID=A0A0L0CAZ4_LUCCU|nr:hypothetical protein FF38_06576 [Lucilia cuprina]